MRLALIIKNLKEVKGTKTLSVFIKMKIRKANFSPEMGVA